MPITREPKGPRTGRKWLAPTAAIAGVIALAGCTSEAQPAPTVTVTVTAEAVPNPTPTVADLSEFGQEQQRKEEAKDYIYNDERNEKIAQAMQDAGERIIQADQSGQIGPFDFYNWDTNEVGRYGNEGWGSLQHNPQYGGSPDQVIITVYQNSDGSINLDKGVQGISLNIADDNGQLGQLDEWPGVWISEDNEHIGGFSYQVFEIWGTFSGDDRVINSTMDYYDLSSDELQRMDNSVLEDIHRYMERIGL